MRRPFFFYRREPVTFAVFEECWPHWQSHFAPRARLRLGGVALFALAENLDLPLSDAAGFLSENELKELCLFRLKKRRVEWLGGRLAAKWAAAGLLGGSEAEWKNLVVDAEEDGRPYLTIAARTGTPFISISHSGPMAAALAANIPCGLDIEQPSAKIHTVRPRFVAPEEKDILNAISPDFLSETERLTLLWAAKEAIRKMVRASPLLGLSEILLISGSMEGLGSPEQPMALTFASGREREDCPVTISVLCFIADNLAWAIACSPSLPNE